MMTVVGLTTIMLFVLTADSDAEFLSRVENTRLVGSKVEAIPRVERDPEGKVVGLRLHRMQLSADDFAALGRLKTLRSLDLSYTNVTDAELRKLCELPSLAGLNLTKTEVTSESIDSLMKLASLRSLCLGSVAVTPESVACLKKHFHDQDKRLSLGYSQRK